MEEAAENEELDAAATRIQAIQRGRQERAEKGKKVSAAVLAEEEKEMEEAAVRMQSAARGRLARLEAEAKKTGGKVASDDQADNEEAAAAATRIQAIQRGRSERARLGQKIDALEAAAEEKELAEATEMVNAAEGA